MTLRPFLLLVFLCVAAGAGWMGYASGQWHYLAASALAPLLWIIGRN